MQRLAFEEEVYQRWAEHWHCSPELFGVAGASFRLRNNQGGTPAIHLSTICKHTFIEHAPAHGDHLAQIVGALPSGSVINATAVAEGWAGQAGTPHAVETITNGLIFHLFPLDLPERHLPGSFALRRLTHSDDEQMGLLADAASVEEVSEAYVSVKHEMACGVFQLRGQGETPVLVTAASAYERAGFVDPGVLTHPDFRGRGFGSAAIHAICQWAIRQKRAMQYRCDQENAASMGLARRLGFRQFVVQDSIWLK